MNSCFPDRALSSGRHRLQPVLIRTPFINSAVISNRTKLLCLIAGNYSYSMCNYSLTQFSLTLAHHTWLEQQLGAKHTCLLTSGKWH